MRLISHCERVRSTSVAIYVLGFWIATNRLAMKGLQAKLAMTIGTIIPHPSCHTDALSCHTERSEVSKNKGVELQSSAVCLDFVCLDTSGYALSMTRKITE